MGIGRRPPVVVNVGTPGGDRASSEAELLAAQLKAMHKLLVDVLGEQARQRGQLDSLQRGQFHINRSIDKVGKEIGVRQPRPGPRRHSLDVDEVVVPFPEHLRREPA